MTAFWPDRPQGGQIIRGLARALRLPGRIGRWHGGRRTDLPDFATFHDIRVVPPQEVYLDRSLVDGGPLWPGFDDQTWVRHCRRKGPVYRLPALSGDDPVTVDEPCIWGGSVIPTFGHMCTEFLTRILWSVCQRPDDPILFVTEPGHGPSDMPAAFWAILDWFGVGRGQVRIVTRPLLVKTLRVMPQAELWNFGTPGAAYLDLLEENERRNCLRPKPADLLYVTRAGMIARGMGGHAGEAHLVAVLQAMGVAILDPAVAPLRDQLSAYAGARRIVFAEGSALHGRQLLGRKDQRIVVLARRPRQKVARTALTPRVTSLDYVEAARATAAAIRSDGAELGQRALSFYDLAEVFRAFAQEGIDLTRRWDDAAFRAARDADVAIWTRRLDPAPASIRLGETLDRIRDVFAGEGVAHLLPRREGVTT